MERVSKRVFVILLLLGLALTAPAPARAVERGRSRTVGGTVYFTNDSPPRRSYLFKLYTRDMKRVVATQRPNGRADFEFKNIRPGRYVLTVTGPYICSLWYEVDVRRQSRADMTILGDADCGSHRMPSGIKEEE
jgi:hypothetical protein